MNLYFDVILPSIMVIGAIIGNSFIILIWCRPVFKKMPTKLVFCLEALFEILSILQLVPQIVHIMFDFDIFSTSGFSCKFFKIIEFMLPAITSYMLVIMSLERISMILFSKIGLFKKLAFKGSLITAVIALNLILYAVTILLEYDLTEVSKETNGNHINETDQNCIRSQSPIFSIIDLVNSTLIPFLLMFLCSVALIDYIFKMRKRVKYQSSKESKSHLKDIQFSVTILLMNVNFLVFNLPICVLNFISGTPDWLLSRFDYFFYTQYFCNFYIYLFFNKLFAREFWLFVGVENTQ